MHTCSAGWYYNYWGYYWGWWVGPGVWALGGCGRWRTVLAFSFMAMFTFLVTSILVSPPRLAVCLLMGQL